MNLFIYLFYFIQLVLLIQITHKDSFWQCMCSCVFQFLPPLFAVHFYFILFLFLFEGGWMLNELLGHCLFSVKLITFSSTGKRKHGGGFDVLNASKMIILSVIALPHFIHISLLKVTVCSVHLCPFAGQEITTVLRLKQLVNSKKKLNKMSCCNNYFS